MAARIWTVSSTYSATTIISSVKRMLTVGSPSLADHAVSGEDNGRGRGGASLILVSVHLAAHCFGSHPSNRSQKDIEQAKTDDQELGYRTDTSDRRPDALLSPQ